MPPRYLKYVVLLISYRNSLSSLYVYGNWRFHKKDFRIKPAIMKKVFSTCITILASRKTETLPQGKKASRLSWDYRRQVSTSCSAQSC